MNNKKELFLKRKLVEALDMEYHKELDEYITLNTLDDGNVYYWYLDGDGLEAIIDMNGNIIKDTEEINNLTKSY